MDFQPEKVVEFLTVFEEYKDQIKSANGCTRLQLIQNTNTPSQIATLSEWVDEESLNNYRNSDTFKKVWPLTKLLFKGKPHAVSYGLIVTV
jgi:heme-degrading monooxygenase HmoA